MKLANSHGSSRAQIYFLGGFGTKEDVNQGLALSGTIERSLESQLRGTGVHLKECYRAVRVKELVEYRGGKKDKVNDALKKIDVAHYDKLIYEEIMDLKPRVIVPLDDLALELVFPKLQGAKKPPGRKSWMHCYRGSILDLRLDWRMNYSGPVSVIPTYGPMSWYVDPANEMLAKIDFHRITKERNNAEGISEDWNLWINRGFDFLRDFISRQLSAKPKFLVVDIETWGGIPWCLCLCFDGKESISVGLINEPFHNEELALVWKLLDKLFRSGIPIVNQNMKYDWIILERFGFKIPRESVIGDPMLGQNLCYPELPKGLDILTSIHTSMPYYKDEGKEWNPKGDRREILQLYNAKDGISTWRVHDSQMQELEELDSKQFGFPNASITELYAKRIMPSLAIYKRIDEVGLRVDHDVKKQLIEKYESLYERNLATLQGLANKEFNPRSPKQLGDFLYTELKYPKRTKTDDSGGISWKTDKDTLDDLMLYHGEKNALGRVGLSILRRIVVCRKLAGVINYLNTPLHPGGIWKCSYNVAGTNTNRTSAAKTIDREFKFESWKNGKLTGKEVGLGRSLQTITKHGFNLDEELYDDFESKVIADDLRSMFRPRHGYVFIEGDGSQAEARVVAILAKNWNLLNDFDKKPKVHAKTAAAIFGIRAEDITKSEPFLPGVGMPYYDLGKRIRHAGNLGIGEFRLAQMTHIPIHECKMLLEKFHSIDPTLRGIFHREIEDRMMTTKVLRTPLGYFRQFFRGRDKKHIKDAYAYIPQNTVSRHTGFSMDFILADFGGVDTDDVHFLVEAHDGLLAEVKMELKDKYLETFKRVYERPIDMNKGSLPRDVQLVIPCELSVGESWSALEEVHL